MNPNCNALMKAASWVNRALRGPASARAGRGEGAGRDRHLSSVRRGDHAGSDAKEEVGTGTSTRPVMSTM